jgi:hypothetical protein
MTSRKVRVGSTRNGTDQLITTTYLREDDGRLHEHVTLQTPTPITDTQRLRLVQSWELDKGWPT